MSNDESLYKDTMHKLILILLFISCNVKNVSIFHTKDFVLIDTSFTAVGYTQNYYDEGFPIYYYGAIKDTIRISRYLSRKYTPRPQWPDSFYATSRFSDNNLKIEVDTSIHVNNVEQYFHRDSVINCHASVFTIRNISDTAVHMGITYSVYYMHRELKNRKGEWVTMGEPIAGNLGCATGQPSIYLFPGDIMVSKVNHFQGNFVTDCRLAFGWDGRYVYSNIFQESIDESILNRPN